LGGRDLRPGPHAPLRGAATLELELQHAGITYRVRTAFQRGSTTPRFDEGTRISVLVDPLNPKRAIPLARYEEPGADLSGIADRALGDSGPRPAFAASRSSRSDDVERPADRR